MIVNTAQGGGGSLPLNLHVQPDEPAIKEGLWIKAPEKHAVKQITTKDTFVIGGSWRTGQTYPNIPYRNVGISSAISVGHKIYVCFYISRDFYLGIYDTDTNTWTTKIYYATSVSGGYSGTLWYNASDNCIVGFKLADNGYVQIAYDIAKDTLTGYNTTFSIPANYSPYCSSYNAVGINNVIYGLRADTEYDNNAGSYNTTITIYALDLYTMTESLIGKHVDSNTASNCGISYGTVYSNKIYFIYGSNGFCYGNKLCCFDLTTHEFKFWALPKTVDTTQRSMSIVQNILYIAAKGIDNSSVFYAFNIITETSVTLTIPISPDRMGNIITNCCVGSSLYLMDTDGTEYDQSMYVYDTTSETLPQNSLAILSGSIYRFILISTVKMLLETVMNNVWWYDTDFREYPTYIGDGTKFNKIKN